MAITVSAEGEGGVQPMAIAPGAITSMHIADDIMQAGDIGSGAVGNAEIATDAVHTEELNNSTIIVTLQTLENLFIGIANPTQM